MDREFERNLKKMIMNDLFCHMISNYELFSYWGSSRSGEEKQPGLPAN